MMEYKSRFIHSAMYFNILIYITSFFDTYKIYINAKS